MINKVFVYGTFRQGEEKFHLIEPYVNSITKAEMRGWMFNLGLFPTAIKGKGRVIGELIELRDPKKTLKLMDFIEGYSEEAGERIQYKRIKTTVQTINGNKERCHIYVHPIFKKQATTGNYPIIASGDWKSKERDTYFFYFAYGSCMSQSSLKNDIPQFEVLGKAKLDNYRVAFTRYSKKREGGVADVIQEQSKVTEGVLYLIPSKYLRNLDAREGASAHLLKPVYERITIDVQFDGLKVPVYTYQIINKSEGEIPPSDEYMNIIIEGSHLLSKGYQRRLSKHMKRLREEVTS